MEIRRSDKKLTPAERESWEKWVARARRALNAGMTLIPVHSDLVILVNEYLAEVERERDELLERLKSSEDSAPG